jgi:mRNA-degrading endonuclease RelE of RelBE toxin-antitoxin system
LDNNKYTIALSKQALKDLSHISEPYKSNIENKLLSLEKGLSPEVKKLKNFGSDYRLRVNDYRVLFKKSYNYSKN